MIAKASKVKLSLALRSSLHHMHLGAATVQATDRPLSISGLGGQAGYAEPSLATSQAEVSAAIGAASAAVHTGVASHARAS